MACVAEATSSGSIFWRIEEVSLRLLKGDEDTRIEAAKEIRLLTKTSARNRSRVAAQGVIPPLVNMLCSDNPSAKEAALLALLNLAVKNERNKVDIVNAGALESLVHLFEGEGDLKEYAAAVMLTLSASDANKPTIAQSGAPPLLVEMLESESHQARIDAVMALYNLSTKTTNLPIILASEPVPPLIYVLRGTKKSSKLAEKISALLGSLSVFEKVRSCIAEQEGGILALVEVIENGTPLGREHAVGVILTMCQSSRSKYRDAVLREGIIPGLLELSVEGTPIAQERARALLPILREQQPSTLSNSIPPSLLLENIVFDIAVHVDGTEKAADTAKILLTEMVQDSIRQLRNQNATFVCVPSDFTRSSTRDKVS